MHKLIFLMLLPLGCDSDSPPMPPPIAASAPQAETILLARHPDRVIALEVSPRNRDEAPTDSFTPTSGWMPGDITETTAEYTAPVPTISTLSPSLPEGFAVLDPDGRPLRFVRDGSGGPGSWGVSGDRIRLIVSPGTNPNDCRIRDPGASERLQRFNYDDSGMDLTAFVHRTERIKSARHYGMYLPAPAQVTWAVTVPEAGQLIADVALMRSPLKAEQVSDGVTLIAEVLSDGDRTAVAELPVRPGQWTDLSADLSAWAGQEISLQLRVDPGATSLEDYLMVGEPILYTPKTNPRRIVVFFADTLRADHMGLYGYSRETTPNIDRWAEGAAVFEEVRSVAPWTYPATRSMLSGRMPDQWDDGPVLSEVLSEAGWSTVAFTNNAYLSRFFGMDRGWSWHFYEPGLSGRGQVQTLANAIKKNTDRDALFLVQLMDVHLPYEEPAPYRTLFTDQVLDDLPDPIQRRDVLDYAGDQAVARQYLIDRYDQSLRYLDRAIAPIFERLDENDTVIFVSDHGEEFWEHGGFEHGHTLHEELLRVPLIIHGPDVPAGRVDAPASLLDVTPTILALAGVEIPEGTQGVSLLPAARQEADALAALRARPQGFGFVLYDESGWGTWSEGQKWISQGGQLQAYDLQADPGEQSPTALPSAADNAPWLPVAEEALGRPVSRAWRLLAPEALPERPAAVHLSAPSGVDVAWASLESPNIPPPDIREDDGMVTISATSGNLMPRELFVQLRVPEEPLTVRIGAASEQFSMVPGQGSGAVGELEGTTVGFTITARPGEALQTTASSVEGQLRALGYLE